MLQRDYKNNTIKLARQIKKASYEITGNNNEVVIDTEKNVEKLQIIINGNNNHVKISKGVAVTKWLNLFVVGNDIAITIGDNTTIAGLTVHYGEDKTSLSIGKDCMFSEEVDIWGTDMHSIIDLDSNQIVNSAKDIVIEDHCWIGVRSMILKSVHIHAGSVIAAGAVITSDVPADSIVGGVPAKVLRSNVTWMREKPSENITKRIDNFDDFISEGNQLVTVEKYFDSNRMIKGWSFLFDVDSKETGIYIEFLMQNDKKCTFQVNRERRDDVGVAYQQEKYSDSGFCLKVPENIKKEDVIQCRIICKNGETISAKKIDI